MLGGLALSCSEQPVSVAVRSLEQSGNVAFLCLSRNDREHPGRPMQHCGKIRNSSSEDPGTLHAFVTQMTRGEVAVIDLNEETVVDLNPSKPGFNFIPVGAVPVDICHARGNRSFRRLRGIRARRYLDRAHPNRGPRQSASDLVCGMRLTLGSGRNDRAYATHARHYLAIEMQRRAV